MSAREVDYEALVAPAAVVRSLEGATPDEIAALCRGAEAAGVRAWMLRAFAVGELQRRAEYRDAAVVKGAKELGVGATLAFELAAIHRQLLRPRLEQLGESARFPLAERRWYRIAVDARRTLRRPALELLELAEERRGRDLKYSPRQFTADVLGTATPEPKVARLLRQLAKVRRRNLPALDATEWAPIVEAAERVLADVKSRLSNGRSVRAA